MDAYGSKALFEPSGYCFYPSEIIGGNGVEKEFSEEINTVSPNFVKIYNDAFKAEQSNLNSIIGLGYRLSFEYLIKDYCISINSDRCEDIMKMSLSSCIKEFIHDGTKDIFNCTNWLGNDFAHYVTKHPEMKVDDLKKLIDICVSKIEYNIKERNYIEKIKRK